MSAQSCRPKCSVRDEPVADLPVSRTPVKKSGSRDDAPGGRGPSTLTAQALATTVFRSHLQPSEARRRRVSPTRPPSALGSELYGSYICRLLRCSGAFNKVAINEQASLPCAFRTDEVTASCRNRYWQPRSRSIRHRT